MNNLSIILYWAENVAECVSENPFLNIFPVGEGGEGGGGGMPLDHPSYSCCPHNTSPPPPPFIACTVCPPPLPKFLDEPLNCMCTSLCISLHLYACTYVYFCMCTYMYMHVCIPHSVFLYMHKCMCTCCAVE